MKIPWKQVSILLTLLLSAGVLGALHLIPYGWLLTINVILAFFTIGSFSVWCSEQDKAQKAGARLVFWIFFSATVVGFILLFSGPYVIKGTLAAATVGSLFVRNSMDDKEQKSGMLFIFWIFLPATLLAFAFL